MPSKIKKVLLINDHLGFGGGGDAALNQEREVLLANGYEVYTLGFDKKTTRKQFFLSFEENHNEKKNKLRKFLGSSKITEFIKESIKIIQPDIVHCHLISKYPTSVFKALNNVKVITTLHGPNFFCTTSWGGLKNGAPCEQGIGLKCFTRGCSSLSSTLLYSYMSHKLWNDLSENTNLFHCPSRNIYNVANRLGLSNLIYKPLGIDPNFELSVIKPINTRKTLLFVGAVAEVKGIKVLMESMLEIVSNIPDVLLKIAGRGHLSDWVNEFIIEHNLQNNIDVLGFVPHDSIRQLYIDADVFVMPSIWQEQFGLVGAEALACETPCVASNVGGISEWLQHGQSGFLVPPLSVNDLTEATLTLLSSDELRKKFGMYGREFILNHYSPEKYKLSILEMINKVI
jgi:glycosyltransferase involved in cell wall biosynthesis